MRCKPWKKPSLMMRLTNSAKAAVAGMAAAVAGMAAAVAGMAAAATGRVHLLHLSILSLVHPLIPLLVQEVTRLRLWATPTFPRPLVLRKISAATAESASLAQLPL